MKPENSLLSNLKSFLVQLDSRRSILVVISILIIIGSFLRVYGITKVYTEYDDIGVVSIHKAHIGSKTIDPLEELISYPLQVDMESAHSIENNLLLPFYIGYTWTYAPGQYVLLPLLLDEDDEFDDWGDEEDDDKYWFTKDKINKIIKVHNYLDSLPFVGKVLSFSSILDVATQLNNNKALETLEIGVLYSKIPDSIKKEIIDPYISIENNEARISLRIKDSEKDLRRNDLINKINFDLKNKIGLEQDEYRLGGVLILFNNLLQSLFKSQILTLGFVMVGIFLMFLVLFRNLKLSLIGVIPNFIAAFFILGIIGLLGIPLDMMTITIAAITIGIAVDNSIHYIYRFKEEYAQNNNYEKTVKLCHSTVGVAILNTSITIVFGFSILVLSNFIPTIYFGVFTGLAMLLAMTSVLTLLPSLILILKPFEYK